MYRIDPQAHAYLALEFRKNPIGHHSPALEQLLNVLRAGPVAGKYCLVCIVPFERWVLARLSGRRGVPPVILENHVFTSIEDAEWEIFKRRWRDATGHEFLDLDATP
jgi:hypothetical protein